MAHPEEKKGSDPKIIKLSHGGSLSLGLSINLWELKGDDRTFVFELIDKIDAYEEAAKKATEEKDKAAKAAAAAGK